MALGVSTGACMRGAVNAWCARRPYLLLGKLGPLFFPSLSDLPPILGANREVVVVDRGVKLYIFTLSDVACCMLGPWQISFLSFQGARKDGLYNHVCK